MKNIDIEIINKYKTGSTLESLSDEYGMCIVDIHQLFKAHNESVSREDWARISSKQQRYDIDKDDLYKMFIIENQTRQEVAKHFQCSEALIKKRCSEWGFKKKPKSYTKNTAKTLLNKYGTENLYEVNVEKREETNISRYGAKTPFESWDVQKRISKNKILSDDEACIAKVLNKLGLNWVSEKSFRPSSDSHRVIYTFDFAVFNNDDDKIIFLIEVDGFYHHSHNAYDHKSFNEIIRHKRSDIEKLEFCKDNNIPLLTINELKYFNELSEIENVIVEFKNRLV